MPNAKIPISVAMGDGIGPEIMQATLNVLQASEAPLEFHKVEIGEKVYLKGQPTGIEAETWNVIRNTKAFLKAPITTPQGGGFKSLNVTIRTTLGLYANIRPCVSYFPFIETKHPEMDVVIVRENEEDLYAGIEYRQTPGVAHAIKLISTAGSEKIIRYAFEYARAHNRKKVTCCMKDNILKLTDGLFHKIFEEVAKEYSDIIHDHWIVDIGAAKLADTPEIFDVLVMPNLYGDILSDIGAQISGSVGLVGSANIGEHGAMFEAIHGSAPKRANQNVANPSALILASVLMLSHLGLAEQATHIHNAWLKTIEDGIHTYDIFKDGISREKVGTQEFSQAVIKNLGKKPETLQSVTHKAMQSEDALGVHLNMTHQTRRLIGVDVYVHANPPLSNFLENVRHISIGPLNLTMVTNRGVRVWPEGAPETFCIDQWRLRFATKDPERAVTQHDIVQLLSAVERQKLDMIKTENLYSFDGQASYSQAQG